MMYWLAFLILLGSFALDWWLIVPLCFWVGARTTNVKQALLISFLSVFVTWTVVAVYFDFSAHGVISGRFAGLLHLPSSYLSYVVTGFLGGFMGALSALSGFVFRQWRALKRVAR